MKGLTQIITRFRRRTETNSPLDERKTRVDWDYKKPVDCSDLKWRHLQLQQYIQYNNDARAKEIKTWIDKHKPNPWPEANLRTLYGLIKRLKNSMNIETELTPQAHDQ